MTSPTGKLVVISGPSGAGKTTLLKRLFDCAPAPLMKSVSRRKQGEFLESCEVYQRGDWYGTLHAEVTPSLAAGKWVVLEIDVQGTMAVLDHHPDALTIFVRPVSMAELERRLRDRGTESEAEIQRRLEVARRELQSADRYLFQVVNDDIERAVDELCHILTPRGD